MRVRLDRISQQTLKISNIKRTLGSFGNVEDRSTFGHVSKFAFQLEDGATIEGLLIATFSDWTYWARRFGNRLGVERFFEGFLPIRRRTHYDVCVSTQVGCAVDCKFCASSLLPFQRDLTFDEMLAQIETLRQNLPRGQQLKRIYYSGIGEPLLNYDVVCETAKYLLARHYIPSTINTSGIIPAMEKMMAEKLPVNLIVSIHAPNDALRQKLIPVNKVYPLDDIIRVIKSAPNWMFVEAKYLMLENINDSLENAHELADLLSGLQLVVTLQSYNDIPELGLKKSSDERIREFAGTLRSRGLRVAFLNSNIGEAVEGGCGQMRIDEETAKLKRRRKADLTRQRSTPTTPHRGRPPDAQG